MDIMVSFIIPIYNAEKYIEVCVNSIKKQTIPQWELILVDDGSTDSTSAICEKLVQSDKRIQVIHQQNAGSAVARNSGMNVATGNWVAFIDGDDWIEEDYLETLVPYMKSEYDFIIYSYNEVRGDTTKTRCNSDKEILLGKEEFHLLVMDAIDTECRLNAIAPSRSQFWTKLYNRDFLLRKKIRSDAELRMSQDVMFNLSVYDQANKAIYMPKALYNYRILEDSTCHRYSEQQVFRIKKIMEAIGSYITNADLGKGGELLYQKRVLASLANACILDFCHKNNPNSYAVRRQQFLKLCKEEPFNSALNASVITKFSFKKQVCMWLIKFRCFGLLSIMLRMK